MASLRCTIIVKRKFWMNKEQDTDFSHVDYSLPKLGALKWISYLLAVFVLTIILYFPFLVTVESLVKSSLTQIPGCPIEVSRVNFELFSPKIVIPRTTVPRRCFGQYGTPLVVTQTKLFFRGFTFSPFGPHFRLETNLLSNNISALITTGISESQININNNTVQLESLYEVLDVIKLNGKVKLNAVVKLQDNKLNDLKLTLKSTDLGLAAQSIGNFSLYGLKIKNFDLVANMNKGKIKIKNFILGDQASPVRANFKGSITPNERSFSRSTANITGELAFSESFQKQYSFIDFVMGRFTKKDKFYQIEIKGPLMSPSIQSPRK